MPHYTLLNNNKTGLLQYNLPLLNYAGTPSDDVAYLYCMYNGQQWVNKSQCA